MKRFVPFMLAGWLIGCVLVLLAFAASSHAGPVVKTPTGPVRADGGPSTPCTLARRMDIWVDAEDIMWECVCSVMATGFDCQWMMVAGVDAVRISRKIRLHVLPRQFYYSRQGRNGQHYFLVRW